jgi:hypothetical protein
MHGGACGTLADRWRLPRGSGGNVVLGRREHPVTGTDPGVGMTIETPLTGHDLQDVDELDDDYFEALLEDYLPVA